jgi:hypothetical protein
MYDTEKEKKKEKEWQQQPNLLINIFCNSAYLPQYCTIPKSLAVFDMKDRKDTVFVAGLPQRGRRV